MLSTNDRIIKLWNLKQARNTEVSKCQVQGNQLIFPTTKVKNQNYEGVEKTQFRNCHNYNINSLSVSPDGETFLSSDDLRIHLWNLENNIVAYNLVDLKPPKIEEIAQVITHMEYHPRRSDIFLFSSSKGYVCYCDLRISS